MRIDKQKLVDLLVEKTNMDRDEIKAQLDQLIERILDAAKRGKALEIKEFGVFYFDEEGELSFDPSEELSTEISFKYAGMKPVELKPERDTSISEQKQEEVQEEEETEDDLNDFFAEEPDAENESEEEDEFDDSLYDPFAPEALEPLEEPAEEKPQTTIDDIKPVSARRPVKKKKDYTGVFILIGIILVAVIIGGYFYYIGTQTQELDERAEATAQTDPQLMDEEATGTQDFVTNNNENAEEAVAAQEREQNPAATEQPGTNEVSEEEIVSESGVPISQTNQPLYGLRGTVVEQANSGYSIVLHSFTSEERAMSAANRLREDGYRVIVTSRTVYENMVWRVSVGQFETLGDAQQATTQLPTPYNTQNFIHRIRTN